MPALGWTSPDRKPWKLNIPVTDELKDRLDKAALKRGVKRTELARELLEQGLKRMRA